NTYGFLNVSEAFAEDYPKYVNRVIDVYEKARKWTIENPEEAAEILADEASIPLEVARKQIERNDFSEPIPGKIHLDALVEAGKVLQDGQEIDTTIDIEALVTE